MGSFLEYRLLLNSGSYYDPESGVVTTPVYTMSGVSMHSEPLRGLRIFSTGVTHGAQALRHLCYRDVVHRARILGQLAGVTVNTYYGLDTCFGVTISGTYSHEILTDGEGYNYSDGTQEYFGDSFLYFSDTSDTDRWDGHLISAPFWYDQQDFTWQIDWGEATYLMGATQDGSHHTSAHSSNDPNGNLIGWQGVGNGAWTEEHSLGIVRAVFEDGITMSMVVPAGSSYGDDWLDDLREGWGEKYWPGRTMMLMGSDRVWLTPDETNDMCFHRSNQVVVKDNSVGLIGMPYNLPPDAPFYRSTDFTDGLINVAGQPWIDSSGITIDLYHSHVVFFGNISTDRPWYTVINNGPNWIDVGINPGDYQIPASCTFVITTTPRAKQIVELANKAQEYRATYFGEGSGEFSFGNDITNIMTGITYDSFEEALRAGVMEYYPVMSVQIINELQLAWQPITTGVIALSGATSWPEIPPEE